MKKDAYYFPHDANAQNDEKLLYIISKFGMTGYGLYWCWIEAMHEQADGKMTVKLIEGLALRFKVDKDLLLQFYNEAITISLFLTDGTKYWSQRVLRNKDEFEEKRWKKSQAGKAGMQSRWGSNNKVITSDNTVITKHNKGKESKVKKRKGCVSPFGDKNTASKVSQSFDDKGRPLDHNGNPLQDMTGMVF